jgi:D-alanyl-D-alanine carboxypeptidase
MKKNASASIETFFRDQVQKDGKIKSGHLLVHSDKLGFHLNLAEGAAEGVAASPEQPYYVASVGKLFTAVLISMLYEQGRLAFDDSISRFLDSDLLSGLHVYEGKEYTDDIKVKNLLNHTSGLPDHFYPLLDKVLADPAFTISPRGAVEWSKEHQQAHGPPGSGFQYSDTNYHLLGLIVESVTGMPFHDALKEHIFTPLGMTHSYMLHFSDPIAESPHPIADFYSGDVRLTPHRGYASVDYAGGGVVAPAEDQLKFMQALASFQIITGATFEKMKDWVSYAFGIDYGYGLMKFKTIPILMPKKFNVWGHAGATGAFMFYHPAEDIHLIGNFHQFGYERKGVRFMMKVINKLI